MDLNTKYADVLPMDEVIAHLEGVHGGWRRIRSIGGGGGGRKTKRRRPGGVPLVGPGAQREAWAAKPGFGPASAFFKRLPKHSLRPVDEGRQGVRPEGGDGNGVEAPAKGLDRDRVRKVGFVEDQKPRNSVELEIGQDAVDGVHLFFKTRDSKTSHKRESAGPRPRAPRGSARKAATRFLGAGRG